MTDVIYQAPKSDVIAGDNRRYQATQIELEGFEDQKIEIKPAGLFSGPKVLVNGQAAKKNRWPKRGQMLLQKDNGTEVVASWKPTLMGFDLPKLLVEGKVIEIAKPIKGYEIVWAAIPILLVFVGGFLGGITGFFGFRANVKVFRSERNTFVKFLLTAGISVIAMIAYAVLVTLLFGVTGL